MDPVQGQRADERVERSQRPRIALQAALVQMLLEVAGGGATKGGRRRPGMPPIAGPLAFVLHNPDDDRGPADAGSGDLFVSGEK